ncbi:MAG TPA: YbaK/EbsC family protein [Actinomycetales bacterium]|nr:YbaK/EbsC family protein [Actinomycetales bacterium]
MQLGSLDVTVPALAHPDLLPEPVRTALRGWPRGADVGVAPIDAGLSDTAAFGEAYGVDPAASANCVVIAGRRAGEERIAACVVLATTRADVNTVVKRRLDVRKCSFLPMERAVELTSMEYGGITPVGLPPDWPVLIDSAVLQQPLVVVGSGVRHSKLVLPGALLGELPGAEVVEGLARPVA